MTDRSNTICFLSKIRKFSRNPSKQIRNRKNILFLKSIGTRLVDITPNKIFEINVLII